MRVRGSVSVLLVAIVAALPSLMSLCELRCVSPGLATQSVPEAPSTPTCSGHETDSQGKGSEPSDSSHDCGGHALLAKGGSVGFEFQLAQAFVRPAIVSRRSGIQSEASNEAFSASRDLSASSGRSPAVLRL